MILFRWRFDRSPLRSRWRRFLRSPRIGITKRGHWGFERSLEEWTHFSMAPCPWLSRNSANMARTSAVNSICDCLFLPLLEDVLLRELDNLEMTAAILRNKSTRWWTIPKEEKKNRSHIASASGSWSLSSLSSFTTMEGGGEISLGTSLLRGEDMSICSSLSVESRFLYSTWKNTDPLSLQNIDFTPAPVAENLTRYSRLRRGSSITESHKNMGLRIWRKSGRLRVFDILRSSRELNSTIVRRAACRADETPVQDWNIHSLEELKTSRCVPRWWKSTKPLFKIEPSIHSLVIRWKMQKCGTVLGFAGMPYPAIVRSRTAP